MAQMPPSAKRIPHSMSIHGHTRTDEYYWLRQKSNEEVIAYLEAENGYSQAMMAHTTQLQETLYQEMLGRIQETDLSVPERIDDFYYYHRTEQGQQYRIYCRKRGSLEHSEEVLLDLNLLAADHAYVSIGAFAVSPDHRLLAYALDSDGSEDFVLLIKDLESGDLLADRIPHVTDALEWADDNQTIFYAVQDEAKRPHKLLRHKLGDDPADDTLIHHEESEMYRVNLYKTKDRQYLALYLRSVESAEIRLLRADDPAGVFALVHPRQYGLRYQVEHRDGIFYLLTNENAPGNKIMTVPAEFPLKQNWQTLVPHQEDVQITGLDIFANHLVLYQRQNGLRALRVYDFANMAFHDVSFDEPVYTYQTNQNPEFNARLLRFTYMSLTTPDTVYDYDMVTRERELKKRQQVLGGFDPDNYQSQRIFATADDGAQIPISLVHKKGIRRDGQNPTLLYGYGSYGINIDPGFNSNLFSLIDRGFIFAIAHIRGGQEMGRSWYDQGKFLNKRNTFTDFIAAGRAMVEAGFTSHEKLAIMGRSAGGLLIGATLNLAPDLAAVAVAGVPFVDVVTTMLDDSIPLTVNEYEEWGNPNDPEFYRYMLSYSPYDNVEAKAYPHLLVTAGLNDPRVQYWEPAKWTARLRAFKSDRNLLLLKTNMGAGHGGASGRYEALKERAFEYAFILDILGVS